ncbi:MAG: sulfotransferase domain-containing protein [Planctomycetota bacterium]
MSGAGLVRFVVLASPKSGTTWLQRLISAVPGLYCGESAPFGRYSNEANPSGARTTLDESAFRALGHMLHGPEQHAEALRLASRFWDAAAAYWLDRTGARVYGEKFTPYRGAERAAVAGIARYSARLRALHLVRDPRDAVVSGCVHQLNIAARQTPDTPSEWATPDEAESCLEARQLPDALVAAAAEHWTDVNREILAGLGRIEHVRTVRYESMLREPLAEAAWILRFVAGDEIAVSDALVAAAVEASSFKALSGGRARGEEDRRSFFRSGTAGGWDRWLSPEQVLSIESVAGAVMDEIGYPRVSSERVAC